jgi:enamine deaminase RidA (YjgF/YER057c/UK114 family)
LNILGVVKEAAGSFDGVERFVQLQGFVLRHSRIRRKPQVVNGASDLLVSVFGERGRHTRAAVTVAGLPMGAAVEVTPWCN